MYTYMELLFILLVMSGVLGFKTACKCILWFYGTIIGLMFALFIVFAGMGVYNNLKAQADSHPSGIVVKAP